MNLPPYLQPEAVAAARARRCVSLPRLLEDRDGFVLLKNADCREDWKVLCTDCFASELVEEMGRETYVCEFHSGESLEADTRCDNCGHRTTEQEERDEREAFELSESDRIESQRRFWR